METMEDRLRKVLKGEMLDTTLQFLRQCLRFRPEDRASAQELLSDPWLKQQAWTKLLTDHITWLSTDAD